MNASGHTHGSYSPFTATTYCPWQRSSRLLGFKTHQQWFVLDIHSCWSPGCLDIWIWPGKSPAKWRLQHVFWVMLTRMVRQPEPGNALMHSEYQRRILNGCQFLHSPFISRGYHMSLNASFQSGLFLRFKKTSSSWWWWQWWEWADGFGLLFADPVFLILSSTRKIKWILFLLYLFVCMCKRACVCTCVSVWMSR